jgi:uncharacterized protein
MRKPITQILSILRETLPYVQNLYRIDSMEVFGSYVRSEENDESDLDILVSFTSTPSLIKFIELENYLTDKLGIKVDLVMKDALKRNLRQKILHEAKPI